MFRNLFFGRYGVDALSIFLVLLSIIFMGSVYTFLIGVFALIFALYRMFSRNINRRYQELQYFNRLMNKIFRFFAPIWIGIMKGFKFIINKFKTMSSRFRQRKTHVFVKCATCKNTLRLPKGKGKLKVRCPVCSYEFFKKT